LHILRRKPLLQNLKPFIKDHSRPVIKRHLFIAFCCLSIIPSMIVGGGIYYWGWNNILNNAEVYSYDLLEQISDNVEYVTDSIENMALGIAINRELIYSLSFEDTTINLKTRSQVIQKIENVLYSNSNLAQKIYIETPESTIYSSTTSTSIPSRMLRIYGSSYEEEVMNKRGSYLWLSDTLNPSVEEPITDDVRYVRCSTMLLNTAKTNACGILSIFLRISALKSAITGTYKSLKDCGVFLVDRNGKVIVSDNDKYTDLFKNMSLKFEGNSGYELKKIKGGSIYLYYIKNSSTDWYVVSLIPQNSLTEDLQQSKRLVGICIVFLVLLCFFLSYFLTAKIICLLDPLLSAMKSVKQGDLSARVSESSDNELSIVGQVFNQTLDHYEELLKENYQKENMLAIARLNALQGQLSPHFLSNTLDSINWTLVERHQYDVSEVLVKLAHLLRYSISCAKDMVPLSEEINSIICYLDICKLRFEDKLQYKINIDETLYQMTIPRFLLQPLVENGIVHGIEKKIDPGYLVVHGYKEERYTVIEVIDNGPGLSPEIKELLTKNENPSNSDRAHVGVTNVIERIRLIYGKGYGLVFLDNEPQGTRIRILLPPLK